MRSRRFDLIVAALVLQHIEPALCREYLADFARMATAVYLLSRTDNDFGTNVFAEVFATGRFDAGEVVEVDSDPRRHQLRVLGRTTFDDVRLSNGSGHYEILLRSRRLETSTAS